MAWKALQKLALFVRSVGGGLRPLKVPPKQTKKIKRKITTRYCHIKFYFVSPAAFYSTSLFKNNLFLKRRLYDLELHACKIIFFLVLFLFLFIFVLFSLSVFRDSMLSVALSTVVFIHRLRSSPQPPPAPPAVHCPWTKMAAGLLAEGQEVVKLFIYSIF